MVDPSGLEPLAFSVSRKRSNQTELRVQNQATIGQKSLQLVESSCSTLPCQGSESVDSTSESPVNRSFSVEEPGPEQGQNVSIQATVGQQSKWWEYREKLLACDDFCLIPSQVGMYVSSLLRALGSRRLLAAGDIKYLTTLGKGPKTQTSLANQKAVRYQCSSVVRWAESAEFSEDCRLLQRRDDEEEVAARAKTLQAELLDKAVLAKAEELVKPLLDTQVFQNRLADRIQTVCEEEIEEALQRCGISGCRPRSLHVQAATLVAKHSDRFLNTVFDKLVEPWLGSLLECPDGVDLVKLDKAMKAVKKTCAKKSWLYIVKPLGIKAVKIGFTSGQTVKNRIDGLQTSMPTKLLCLSAFPGTAETEASLHRVFGDRRLTGEWFVFDATLQAFVAETHAHIRHLLSSDASQNRHRRLSGLIYFLERQPREAEYTETLAA